MDGSAELVERGVGGWCHELLHHLTSNREAKMCFPPPRKHLVLSALYFDTIRLIGQIVDP